MYKERKIETKTGWEVATFLSVFGHPHHCRHHYGHHHHGHHHHGHPHHGHRYHGHPHHGQARLMIPLRYLRD